MKRSSFDKRQWLKLPEGDKLELSRFRDYLRDSHHLTPRELLAKHWQYMGISEAQRDTALAIKP